jgi:hypothetical protein
MEPSRSDFCRDFEGSTHKRGTGGMRSVASAPDFSQMKRMHDTFKSTDSAKTKSKRNLHAVRSRIPTTQPPHYLLIVCSFLAIFLTQSLVRSTSNRLPGSYDNTKNTETLAGIVQAESKVSVRDEFLRLRALREGRQCGR